MSYKRLSRFLALILSLTLFICAFTGSVSTDAAVAKSAKLTNIVSSEESLPSGWSITIDGGSVTAVITDKNAPDGYDTCIEIKDASLSVWGKFYDHRSVLTLYVGGLTAGDHTLYIYEEKTSDPLTWNSAIYTITKNGEDIYFKSPAGGSEKQFLNDLNKNYDPLDYVGLPRISGLNYYENEKLKKAEQLKRIISLTQDLCKNASSNAEKVRMIHDWLAKNLSYDMESLYSGSIYSAADPLHAFETKKAVCSGFARLARIMFGSVGIPCINIIGATITNEQLQLTEGKDYTDDNHEWNAVYVNGEWKILDITWDCPNSYYGKYGSSSLKDVSGKDPDYKYLFISPELFGMSHISIKVSEDVSNERFVVYDGGLYSLFEDYYISNEPTAIYLFPINDDPSVTIGGEIDHKGVKYQIKEITDYAFYGNKSIKEITVLPGVERIGAKAFANCSNLRNVVLGEDVRYIYGSAFSGCKKLKEIVFPSGLLTIGSKAFFNCKSLEKITLHAKYLQKIGKNAFKKAGKDLTVYIPKETMKKYKKMFKKTNAVLEILDQQEN